LRTRCPPLVLPVFASTLSSANTLHFVTFGLASIFLAVLCTLQCTTRAGPASGDAAAGGMRPALALLSLMVGRVEPQTTNPRVHAPHADAGACHNTHPLVFARRSADGEAATRRPRAGLLQTCPLQSAYTCCSDENDALLARHHAACLAAETDEACCSAIRRLSCAACDGHVATGRVKGACVPLCHAAYSACERSMFAASGSGGGAGSPGSLTLCTEDSLLCASPPDVLAGAVREGGEGEEEAYEDRRARAFCEALGYAVAPPEAAACYNSSVTHPPQGWTPPRESKVKVSRSTPTRNRVRATTRLGQLLETAWVLIEDALAAVRAGADSAAASGESLGPNGPLIAAAAGGLAAAVIAYALYVMTAARSRADALRALLEGRTVGGNNGWDHPLTADELRARRLARFGAAAAASAEEVAAGREGEGSSKED
jgi:hypothetical protein